MRRIAVPAIVLGMICLSIGWVRVEEENTLITRSRRLLTNNHWLDYEWLDQDRILYRIYHGAREFRVLDVRTGISTPVRIGDPKLAAAQTLMGGMIPLPDGRSFITFVVYGSNDAVWIPISPGSLRPSKRMKKWPKGEFVGWLESGTTFLMDTTDYRGKHEDKGPKRFQRYRWPALTPVGSLPPVAPLPAKDGVKGITWSSFAFDANSVHLVSRWGKDTSIAKVDPQTGKVITQRVELPVERNVVEVARSPDGKKVLWVLNRDPGNDLAEMRFWLSRSDAGGFTEVGHTGETPKLRPNPWLTFPQKVRWRPDGTAITFAYRDGLFLMPLPRN